jgi:glucose-1-phosphate cytidylyltransferase
VTLKNGSHRVLKIEPVRDSGLLINAGFFAFKRDIFNYIRTGEDLVGAPFNRLIEKDLVMGYKYDRFWAMDTFKEQQELTDLCNGGRAPWELWKPKN